LVRFFDSKMGNWQPQLVATGTHLRATATELTRTSPSQFSCPRKTGCHQFFRHISILIKIYYILNATNYIAPCEHVLTVVTGHFQREKEKEKKQPHSCLQQGWGHHCSIVALICHCPPPPLPIHHHDVDICGWHTICCPCLHYPLLPHCCHVVISAICSLSSPSSLAIPMGWADMAPFVISTSIAPYKQWLAGGVVVLCDVAPGTHCHPASRGSQQWCRVGGGLLGQHRGCDCY
jgi:hypothetical protein